jgi:hypothetical protein
VGVEKGDSVNEFAPSQPRIASWIVGWTIFAVLLIGGVTAGLWATGVLFADVSGKGNARKQLKSADYRITAYDHFFNLCASVQTTEQALNASFVELSGATGDDADRIRTNITGQTVARAEAVNQYNADARKSYTLGQFRSSDLPYQLPTTYRKGQEMTSCSA